jgi:hypothetical protein
MDLTSAFGIRPFTRAQALGLGLTAWQWQQLVKHGRLHQLRHGVYVTRLADDDLGRYQQKVGAGLMNRTNHVAFGDSAFAIHELPNPWFMPWERRPVLIGAKKARRSRKVSKLTGVAPLNSDWGPVTDLTMTAAWAASALPLPQALMVIDVIAQRLADTRDRFVLSSESCRTSVRLRLTEVDLPGLRYADPAADSPAESCFRGHLIEAGVTDLRCGVPVKGATGNQYFADLLLGRLIVEVDGRGKYRTVQDLIDEKFREDNLREAGFDFLRVWVEDLYANPDREVQRFLAAVARKAAA